MYVPDLHRVDADVGEGGDGLEDVAEDVDGGDVHDRLELAQEHVRNHSPEDRGEVAEHRKGVVDHLRNKIIIKYIDNLIFFYYKHFILF